MARETAAQKRKREEAEAAAEATVAEPAEQSSEQPPNGVFVEKVVNPDGNISVNVAPVGGVQITEVQTLLEIGLRTFRDQIGLGQTKG